MGIASEVGSTRRPYQAIRPIQNEKITILAASTQSSAFSSNIIRVFPTVDCWINIDGDVAVADDGTTCFCAGGIYQFFIFNSGSKLAVIRDSGDGYLHITAGG